MLIDVNRHLRAPLFDEMVRHSQNIKGNFYVPGHKQGHFFDAEGYDWFKKVLMLDATEVGMLDDLHAPTGVIREAECLAADAFRARDTLFLVGGSTVGNLAAVLALCNKGDELVALRSSHQSVFNAAILAGIKVHFLSLNLNKETGLEKPIYPDELTHLLSKRPKVKAVLITSPSYYGTVQPINKLAVICHKYGVPMIVDEAHGAHFSFYEKLPPSAMEAGADISIQSTHKMLTSVTMSSMLHIQNDLVDADKVRHWLKVLESSSPSYLLMASLDVTRRLMVLHGRQKIKETLSSIEHLKNQLSSLSNMKIIESDDKFKLTLLIFSNKGYFAQEWLSSRGCYIEMATPCHILFCFSVGTSTLELKRLQLLLLELDRELDQFTHVDLTSNYFFDRKGITIRFSRQDFIHPKELIPISESHNRIAAEVIVPYPPGIPLILPGEKIGLKAISYLNFILTQGARVRGIYKKSIAVRI